MKANIHKIIPILSLFILVACGKDPKEKEENKTIKKQEQKKEIVEDFIDLNLTDSSSEVVFTDPTVQKIYTQYLAVKRGLVNSNTKLVMQQSKILNESIVESESTKQLKATAQLIALTKSIDKQRDFFVTLTEEVTELVDGAAITSGEVYKQFCPMAFDGTGGYWLSNSKEIRNPYFGDKMLKCGMVKEDIK